MWAFWVLFVVVAVLLVLVMVKIERRRREAHVAEYQAAAAKVGAAYAYEAPAGLLSKLKGFDLTFSDGASLPHSVRDVFTRSGPKGEVHVFLHEHRGNLAGRAAGGMHRESVGCVVSPLLRLPRFRLSPERSVEKIASVLGWRDVDFESHPGFSASYYLHTEDEAAVRGLFKPKALSYFENRPGLHVEGRGDTLLVYRFKVTASLHELPGFWTTAEAIADLFRK